MTLIRGKIVTPEGVLENGIIEVEDGKIKNVSASSSANADITAPEGGWVVPGFVDVHVHGGYGSDFMEATQEAIQNITAFHGRNGTTSMLATSVTAPKKDIDALLEASKAYIASNPSEGARLIGVHLEGPFISEKWPGAQNPEHIVPPNAAWVQEWLEKYPGLLKQLTLAPEKEGALDVIRLLRANGVIAAAGHTDATYDQVIEAAAAGLNQAVHTYNAMTPLHHRKPGVVGAVLTDERITAEIIADGHHVHEAAIKLLTRAKGLDHMLLITDAMSASGLGNGQYKLGDVDVTVRDGVARLAHGDSLAGSTLTMIGAFRFMVERIGLSVPEASRLASTNPAKQLGMDGRIGSIRAGANADFILLTPNLDIAGVYRDGKPIA